MKIIKIVLLIASCALLAAIILPGFQRNPQRYRATLVLEDLRMIDAAIDQYAMQHAKKPGDPVTWADVQPFIRVGTPLSHSNGTDKLGGVFRLSSVGTPPKVAETTFTALSDVADQGFWSPFR